MFTQIRAIYVLVGFLLLAALALGQTFPPTANCTAPLTLFTGPAADGGQACEHDGYIIWSAAGGSPQQWNSIISGEAPMNTGLKEGFALLKADGSGYTNLATTDEFGVYVVNTQGVLVPLPPNRPYQLRLLGLYGEGPNYPTLSVGPIQVMQLCPDQATCMNVRPQLSYLASNGATPYFNLNVNTIWNEEFGSAFSAAVAVSTSASGGAGLFRNGSFAVMNADTSTLTPNVCVYYIDSATPIVCKQTNSLVPLQNFGTDLWSFFGTSMIPKVPAYALYDTLMLKVGVSVPAPGKIGVVVYQFTGPAATSVTVQPDAP